MIKKMSLLLFLALCSTAVLNAQSAHRALRNGDKAYKNKDFVKAKAEYDAALEAENSAKGNYNMGNALYEGKDYEGAAKKYEEAAGLSDDPVISSSAYRNLGDAQYQQEKYKESVEAYKESLRINPGDNETKYNLSKAIRRMQQEQEQDQQKQQDQQNQDQQDQEQQDQEQDQQGEGQPQQGDSDQESKGDPQDQKDPQDGKPQDQDKPQDGDPSDQGKQGQPKPDRGQPKMSREEAERQLGIAAEAEKETMKNLRKGDQSGCRDGKDW